MFLRGKGHLVNHLLLFIFQLLASFPDHLPPSEAQAKAGDQSEQASGLLARLFPGGRAYLRALGPPACRCLRNEGTGLMTSLLSSGSPHAGSPRVPLSFLSTGQFELVLIVMTNTCLIKRLYIPSREYFTT